MSGLRRYAYALFGACVALAIGIALGAGPLQGAATATSTTRPDASVWRDRIASLRGGQVFGESVVRASMGDLLGSSLNGASVTVLVLPGVRDAAVSGVSDAVRQAGGLVTVTARVSAKLIDPAQKTYTASVASNSIDGLRDLSSAASSRPYAQIAALIARAYVGRGSDVRLDDEAIGIDAELSGAKLVTVDGTSRRRGSLVIVLAAGDHRRDDVTAASHVIEVQLVSALAAGADAVLVATPPTGAARGGLLHALGKQAPVRNAVVSTLNVTDGAPAQIAAVYALAAAANGTSGSFGIDGKTATLPPGLAVPGR